MKRFVLAVIAVFVAWSAMDYVIHGVFLKSLYEATAELWRPEDEMKSLMWLMYIVTAVVSVAFACLYCLLVSPKSVIAGVKYGLLFGIATGFPMGFGTYCYTPLPLPLAWIWFIGALLKATVAGVIVGAIIKCAGAKTEGAS